MSSSIWVVMSDVYHLEDDGKPVVSLQRGDWVEQTGECGQLGFRDRANVHSFTDTDGYHEGYMVAKCGSCAWEYVLAPMSCLSTSYYDAWQNLWIVVNPQAVIQTVTLMEVTEDAAGERVRVPLTKLAQDLDTTVKKLRAWLADLVVSRDGEKWFESASDRDRHQRLVPKA